MSSVSGQCVSQHSMLFSCRHDIRLQTQAAAMVHSSVERGAVGNAAISMNATNIHIFFYSVPSLLCR